MTIATIIQITTKASAIIPIIIPIDFEPEEPWPGGLDGGSDELSHNSVV